jgi:hypothetical protein
MNKVKKENLIRGVVALVILLSGVAMIPFINLPSEKIGWDLFAGVYTPELTAIETSGAPGSVFAFTGSNYPPNTTAQLFIDGVQSGEVQIDENGGSTFLLNTVWAAAGQYNITLEVDINASATQAIELIEGGTLVTPPAGFPGPEFSIVQPAFLPVIRKDS